MEERTIESSWELVRAVVAVALATFDIEMLA